MDDGRLGSMASTSTSNRMRRKRAAIVSDSGSDSEAADPGLALLRAGLETLAAPLVLLDEGGRVAFMTAAAGELLAVEPATVAGQSWAALWAATCADDCTLAAEAQRTLLRRAGGMVAVRAWQRPLADTATLVG